MLFCRGLGLRMRSLVVHPLAEPADPLADGVLVEAHSCVGAHRRGGGVTVHGGDTQVGALGVGTGRQQEPGGLGVQERVPGEFAHEQATRIASTVTSRGRPAFVFGFRSRLRSAIRSSNQGHRPVVRIRFRTHGSVASTLSRLSYSARDNSGRTIPSGTCASVPNGSVSSVRAVTGGRSASTPRRRSGRRAA